MNMIQKLFINKYSIKYLLYGPYVEKEETNCKEVIYEITNKGSLKQVSEQNYEVKRKIYLHGRVVPPYT